MKITALVLVCVLLFSACAVATENVQIAEDKEQTTAEPMNEPAEPVEESAEPQIDATNDYEPAAKPDKKPEVVDNAEQNLLLKMSDAECKELNLFLSNFSEASYMGDQRYYPTVAEEKIDFAFLHVWINEPNTVVYDTENDRMGLKVQDADRIIKRFFGETVPHETPANNEEWEYVDGHFMMRGASGEGHPQFSNAWWAERMDNGNLHVGFEVYSDPNVGCCDGVTDKSVYSLKNSELQNSEYDYLYFGEAELKEKTMNGQKTYEIVSYVVHD